VNKVSARPPKKSDLIKSWMQPRVDKRILNPPEYHLIVTEGIKTEPQYFVGLKREIEKKLGDRSRGRIDIQIEGEGDNTLSLLDKAQNYVNRSLNPIKHVWLIYDKDDFPPDDFDNTHFKCNDISNIDIKYHSLWSNQCIELWFLLHFCLFQSDTHREEYYPRLDTYLNELGAGKYEKNRSDIYEILRPKLTTAIKHAKKLLEQNSNPAPSKHAPGTNVFLIFETLSPYLFESI
jgi:hypothetical protein